jgi:hypothetical protein
MTLSIHNSQHKEHNITTLYHYAECPYAKYHYAECRFAECHAVQYVILVFQQLFSIFQSDLFHYISKEMGPKY